MHSDEGNWIEEVKAPYERVVGGSNSPPQSLESLAESEAGGPDELIDLYDTLSKKEENFDDPPDHVKLEKARDFFDEDPTADEDDPIEEQVLGSTEQREKWFEYPKVRILAALKKKEGEIPDVEVINDDWGWGYPHEEIRIVSLLDEYAYLDSEDPKKLARELWRREEFSDFLDDVYADNRDLRREIRDLERAGVKYALEEAYEDRIDTLDWVYKHEVDIVGADELGERLAEAKQDVRERRENVEQDVKEALEERVAPRLEAIEEMVDEIETEQASREPPSFVADRTEEAIHDLQRELERDEEPGMEDLEAEVAKLAKVRRAIRRAFEDERMKASKGMGELQRELEEMNAELTTLSETVEAELSEVYEEYGEELGESYADDAAVLHELGRLVWLLSQLEKSDDALDYGKKADEGGA